MTINYFNPENYKELIQWWKANDHEVISLSSLPIGVVVSENNVPLVMSFVYLMDGTDIAQLAWTTSNPMNGLKQNHKAVELAIDALLIVAQKAGKKSVISFSSSKGLTKILNKKNIISNKNHTLSFGRF